MAPGFRKDVTPFIRTFGGLRPCPMRCYSEAVKADVRRHKEDFWRAMDADKQPIDYLHALSGNLQLVPTDAARQALESGYTAMADSGCCAVSSRASRSCWRGSASWRSSAMPSRGPSPVSAAAYSDPERFGARPVACLSFALDFALFGPAGPASDSLTDKKDPLRRKESDRMEPSGFEPLTPCMPCRERPDLTSLTETARTQ